MIYAENVLICIAIPLVISALFIRGGARRFVLAFLAGVGACLLAAYIGGFFQVICGRSAEEVSIFLSPIIEETMKLIPVLLYLMLFEPRSEKVVHVAVGIGAGFATFENCCYVLTAGAQSLPYVIIRGVAVGVMHLVSMVTLSIGLSLMRRYNVFGLAGVLGSLSLSMTFHGLYNLLVSEPGIPSYVGYAMPMVTAIAIYMQSDFIRKQISLKNKRRMTDK